MIKPNPITIPNIAIEIQPIWDELINKYQSSVVVIKGGFNFTETYLYLVHTRDNSVLLHSVSSHLQAEIANYAKKPDYSYRLLKSAMLEGFFSLRESVAGLVNVVYNLGEDVTRTGASGKILKKAEGRNLSTADYLNELIPSTSRLGIYLDKYRHPFVHREDLSSRLSHSDMLAALFAKEQKRITEFMSESYETSRWLQGIESHIAQECATYLKISLDSI
jgi:hypothetical protein